MATITYDAESPGQSGTRVLRAALPRAGKVVTGKFTFDTSYPTGGEDITDIFNQFASLLGIVFSDEGAPLTLNAKVVNHFPVDYTGKKVLAFGDDTTTGVPAEVANLTDLSTITNVRFFAWGY